jgi:archaellum component FlaC
MNLLCLYGKLTKNIMRINFPIFVLLIANFCAGQKAYDVLENGTTVEKNENIFLSLSNGNLTYDIGQNPTRPVTIIDTIIFLVRNRSVNLYIKPLNPLNFSYDGKNEIIIDKIDQDAANAFKSTTDLAAKFKSATRRSISDVTLVNPPACPFGSLQSKYETIKDSLIKYDKKEKINKQFTLLKELSFDNEVDTKSAIAAVEKQIQKIEEYFTKWDNEIKKLEDNIKTFTCPSTENPFIIKYVFGQLANELQTTRKEQLKRLTNLKRVYELVHNVQKDASKVKDKWWIYLEEIPTDRGKISVYTISVSKSGYKLSTDADKDVVNGEIISEETKQIVKKTMRFRKFQRFVPEVLAGVAFTNLNFPKFGTEENAEGDLVVMSLGEDRMKRVNFTAMINYNYYISDSPVHPLIQLGIGANTDFPTILLGTGLRFNTGGKGRLTLSVGLATSWIKALDELIIGDVVQNDSDVEADIHYELAKPKMYGGIQLNF